MHVTTVSVDDVTDPVAADWVVLDVREPWEWAAGHIEGAVHIPLVLRGPRIKPGTYAGHVALNDLAPTLAALLEVEPPAGSSGRVLTEALSDHPRDDRGRGTNRGRLE